MRRLAVTMLGILAVAVCVQVVVLYAIPRMIMQSVTARADARVGLNRPMHLPMVTDEARDIPLPSPDLLYSTCVLDISKGPVAVTVTPGEAYLSLAVFDMRSDNVFVANDQSARGEPIRLLVASVDGAVPATPAGVTLVRLPGTRGLLLLRGLAATPALREISERARQTLRCGG
jgi:uncharacterized membrane protein